MLNFNEIWKELEGTEAESQVSAEYRLEVESEGCCELCVTEQAALYLVLRDGRKELSVSLEQLGFSKTW